MTESTSLSQFEIPDPWTERFAMCQAKMNLDIWNFGDRLHQIRDVQHHRDVGYSRIESYSEDVFGVSKAYTYQVMDLNRFFSQDLVTKHGTRLRPLVRVFKSDPEAASLHLNRFLEEHKSKPWRRTDLQAYVNQNFPRFKPSPVRSFVDFCKWKSNDTFSITFRTQYTANIEKWLGRRHNIESIFSNPPIEIREATPRKTVQEQLYESTPKHLWKILYPRMSGEPTFKKVMKRLTKIDGRTFKGG